MLSYMRIIFKIRDFFPYVLSLVFLVSFFLTQVTHYLTVVKL